MIKINVRLIRKRKCKETADREDADCTYFLGAHHIIRAVFTVRSASPLAPGRDSNPRHWR